MAGTAAAEKHRWKMAAYVMRAFAALPGRDSPLHRVTVDGVAARPAGGDGAGGELRRAGAAFLRLRHDIAPDNGWLDVVVLRAEGVWQA